MSISLSGQPPIISNEELTRVEAEGVVRNQSKKQHVPPPQSVPSKKKEVDSRYNVWDHFEKIKDSDGRFGREKSSLETIRTELGAKLRISNDVRIGSLDARTIIVQLSSDDDWRKPQMSNRTRIAGADVWFSRWSSPEWRPWRDSPLVPIWIHLPNLPLHLFNFCMLKRICNPIGIAFAVNFATERRSRPNVATVRVEMLQKYLLTTER
nr:uncharacterized protein LOC109159462 [Ipomoea trifida]